MKQLPPAWRAVLVIVAAVLAGGSFALVTTSDDGHGHRSTTTITLGGAGHAQLALTPSVQAQVADQAAAAKTSPDESHSDLKSQAGLTPAGSAFNDTLKPSGQPAAPAGGPTLASPSNPQCRTRLVRNSSSRNGAPVLLFVVHLTDSPPSDEWTGVDANTAWFDTPAAQASSNYIMSRTGLCNYVVPETAKAWTQAAFNPWAISVEVTTNEQPATFMTTAGDLALAKLIYGVTQRWHLPIRRGAVSQNGCRVTRTGIVQHADLGQCGGGHGDILPYSVSRVIANVKAYAAARHAQATLTFLTPTERSRVTRYDRLVAEKKARAAKHLKDISLKARKGLRAWFRAQHGLIHHKAVTHPPNGWQHFHRRPRWDALVARS